VAAEVKEFCAAFPLFKMKVNQDLCSFPVSFASLRARFSAKQSLEVRKIASLKSARNDRCP